MIHTNLTNVFSNLFAKWMGLDCCLAQIAKAKACRQLYPLTTLINGHPRILSVRINYITLLYTHLRCSVFILIFSPGRIDSVDRFAPIFFLVRKEWFYSFGKSGVDWFILVLRTIRVSLHSGLHRNQLLKNRLLVFTSISGRL